MDLNQLKSLISEEIKRKRQNNLLEGDQEDTAVGSQKRPAKRGPPDKPEPFVPEKPEEEQTFKDSIRDSSPEELKVHEERLFKEMISNIDEETLFKFLKATMADTEMQNIISNLIFVYRRLHKTGGSQDDLSSLSDRPGGANLPTPTEIGRNPNNKTDPRIPTQPGQKDVTKTM